MANIYEQQADALHRLLENARADDGATVVIPELQRPYVWTPNQVSLLVDSLIRGWPFGTLLMWKVRHEELEGIPHRQFWRTVDRSVEESGTAVSRRNPPSSYQMVLDGQQRVQSLLLALGGDDWGFKLEDREWAEELQDKRLRGRQPLHKHWSKASLCFDLEAFLAEYRKSQNLFLVDFRRVLTWAITDSTKGQSHWPKPDNYVEPLEKAYLPKLRRRLIRLSRLWQETPANANLKERDFRGFVAKILDEHETPAETQAELREPLGELLSTLRDIKLSNVTYLELVAFDDTLWTRDSYNDAIVNIFTRLNTAGRTLTREEITFAWLKSNWVVGSTGNRSAAKCFEDLLKELAKLELRLEMDDLVSAVSFVWAVSFNEGKLLSNGDLLKGSLIRPMAVDLSTNWSELCASIRNVAELLGNRGLRFGAGQHFSSVYALAVTWSCSFAPLLWEKAAGLSVLEQDSFEKQTANGLLAFLDRWIVCSTWAGRWSGSSSSTAEYSRELAADWQTLKKSKSVMDAANIISNRLANLVKGVETDATSYVRNLSASQRERVSIYRNAMWIWHRLDKARWEGSKLPLRSNRSKIKSHEVDHTISFDSWSKRVEKELPETCEDADEARDLCNFMGNCCLLEKTFNISKSDKSLREFLMGIEEFSTKQLDIDQWAAQLSITPPMLDPDSFSVDEVALAIMNRDTLVRNDLVAFVSGSRTRVD